MHPLRALRTYKHTLGCRGVLAFLTSKVLRRPVAVTIHPPGIKYPVVVRAGTTDSACYRQVLLEKHYDFDLRVNPKIIVDGGANIGMAAVFFANRYPTARIIAVECESSNFKMLKRNTEHYANIIPVFCAIWNETGTLRLHGTKGENCAFRARLSGDGESVPAQTIDTIVAVNGGGSADLVKLDIEGAEKEVFDQPGQWLGSVSTVMVELHEQLSPGCTRSFEIATAAFEHSETRGEIVMRRRSILAALH